MRTLIENAFAITTNILRESLRKARKGETVEGYLNIILNNQSSIADYRIEYEAENTYLIVTLGVETQKILLSVQELTYGTRTYLTCSCLYRTNALYLSNKGIFSCRKCLKLRYFSTTINRTSKHGKFLYQQNQILRLMKIRESMDRVFYRSQYSKLFVRWLELCGKAGMTKEVEDAQRLMEAINNHEQ